MHLKEGIKSKRRGKQMKDVLLFQNNTPIHTASKTINERCYASELRQLKEAIKSKYRGKQRAGVLHDNAPVYATQVEVTEADTGV